MVLLVIAFINQGFWWPEIITVLSAELSPSFLCDLANVLLYWYIIALTQQAKPDEIMIIHEVILFIWLHLDMKTVEQ